MSMLSNLNYYKLLKWSIGSFSILLVLLIYINPYNIFSSKDSINYSATIQLDKNSIPTNQAVIISPDTIIKIRNTTLYTSNNKTVKLFDILPSRRYTILNLWASWCLACVSELKDLSTLAQLYSDKLNIILISVEDIGSISKVNNFLSVHNITNLSSYFDFNKDTYNLVNQVGIPTSLILNADKEVILEIRGKLNWLKPEVISDIFPRLF